MKTSKIAYLSYILFFIASITLGNNAWALNEQQELYLTAKEEFHAGDFTLYSQYQAQLNDYILWPYLEYAFLSQHFKHYPVKQIQNFLHQYKNTWLAQRLHAQWLNFLGENKIWHWYDNFYQPQTAYNSHRCLYIESQLQQAEASVNQHQQAIEALWLKPYSLPKQCDSLFTLWQQQNALTAELAWQRFEMSYANNNTRLARYLMRFMTDEQRVLADELIQAERYADVWLERLEKQSFVLSSQANKRLLRNLSRFGFYQQVADLVKKQPAWLNEDDLIELRQVSAWHFARESGQQAIEWINKVEQAKGLDEYQLRYAMQDKNWPLFLQLFEQANADTQQQEEWLYWYAIAQQKAGVEADKTAWQSKALLNKLAKERSFYGFLAAEQLNLPVQIHNNSATAVPEQANSLHEKLALALELFAVGELANANQEWFYATKNFTKEQWVQAGLISQQAQWHDKTIQAFAKAQAWHAIEQRFPLAWQPLFEQQAKDNNIVKSWLLAMARQESGFAARARSHAGALGVLQLMPQTARQVASKHNIPYQEKQLFDAELNIHLGSLYLKQLLERFDGQYILATAAYNAGPHRVEQWLEKQAFNEKNWAHWVATIPFPETRQYVQNILTYSQIYQHLLGQQDASLSLAQNTTAKSPPPANSYKVATEPKTEELLDKSTRH